MFILGILLNILILNISLNDLISTQLTVVLLLLYFTKCFLDIETKKVLKSRELMRHKETSNCKIERNSNDKKQFKYLMHLN